MGVGNSCLNSGLQVSPNGSNSTKSRLEIFDKDLVEMTVNIKNLSKYVSKDKLIKLESTLASLLTIESSLKMDIYFKNECSLLEVICRLIHHFLQN
jgi:hypothetical protein